MFYKSIISSLLICTPSLALGDTYYGANINGGGGRFSSWTSEGNKIEDDSELMTGQLTLSLGVRESLAFGLTFATGFNSRKNNEEIDHDGENTTFSEGFGSLEAFARYFLIAQGDFRSYVKGGVSLSITEDNLSGAFVAGVGEPAGVTHTTGTSGFSIALGAGMNYFLTDHFFVNLDITDLFLSMGDGVRLNNSIIGTLGVGCQF